MSRKHQFIMTGEEKTEHLPGKTHIYHSMPGVTDTDDLLVIRAIFEPGGGHPFHHHPNKEETLYFISGTAEQWVGEERRSMTPGCSVHIPPGLVHATFNRGTEPVEVLAIITPLTAEGPVAVEVADQEPWKSLMEQS